MELLDPYTSIGLMILVMALALLAYKKLRRRRGGR